MKLPVILFGKTHPSYHFLVLVIEVAIGGMMYLTMRMAYLIARKVGAL